MSKLSIPTSNAMCPQALYLYGTYKPDGTANFGLFCWLSYCWDGDMRVMACIGGDKLTKDRIRETGVFSANLVSESLLPYADYCGYHEGYAGDKAAVPIAIERGRALAVPVLADSPWVFELEVQRTIELNDGTIFLCAVRQVLAEEAVADEAARVEERMARARPVLYTGAQGYFGVDARGLGRCGDWKEGPGGNA